MISLQQALEKEVLNNSEEESVGSSDTLISAMISLLMVLLTERNGEGGLLSEGAPKPEIQSVIPSP